MSLQKIFRRLNQFLCGSHSTRRAGKPTHCLQLESLEDRALPAVLFSPVSTNPVVSNHGGDVMSNSPPVFLIYWGSAWGQSGTSPTLQGINAATNTMLNSSYLSSLSQYRAGLGAAHLAGSAWDTSDPANGFTSSQLADVVKNAYNHLGLPDPDDVNSPLYVVVTPPGVKSDAPNAGGYHTARTIFDEGFDFDHIRYAWIGNKGTMDSVTTVLSHEIVEAVTDPDPNSGITATVGGDNELADGEAQNYTYRVNGVLVQSYWSASDHAYTVGLTPPDASVRNGVLTVTGNVLGSPDDRFNIRTSNGGVQVIRNNEVLSFEPGAIKSVVVNSGLGNDSIVVSQTLPGVPVTLNGGVGNDTFVIGTGNLDDIRGAVTVNGEDGIDTVTLRDDSASFSESYTITNQTVSRVAFGGLTYVSVDGLTLDAESGSNTIAISSTLGPTPVTISNSGGNDQVYVGSNGSALKGSLQNIHGAVTVISPGGSTGLTIDDSADTAARTATLTNGQLTGLAAPITWTPTSASTGGVTGLAIFGGSGGNTFNVTNTSNLFFTTALHPGIGNDTVNVRGTTGSLSILEEGGTDSVVVGGGSLANIAGTINVAGSQTSGGPTTSVTVDGSADSTARTYQINSSSVKASGMRGVVNYSGNINALTVLSGSGNDQIDVLGTPVFTPVTLNPGRGSNAVLIHGAANTVSVTGMGTNNVTVGADGSLGTVAYDVNVNNLVDPTRGTFGKSFVTINDTNDTVGRNIDITSSRISYGGLVSVNLADSTGASHVQGVTINDALHQANHYTVNSVLASDPVTINGDSLDTLSGPASGQVSFNSSAHS